ncbi:hypothetical protein ADIMK_2624 [Marinobacterium lacunae]|uniref:Uncharacterized protein n=1 Tax=Marinobacterium lacunae TaxID=1232683 RepID=A0A081FX45_9GAMM|nr:hypothetical protein [Marinobacterium lacunae]KEA63100.1 hypothetical protein ADIMK_2624 [Marinobacterium lacunae]
MSLEDDLFRTSPNVRALTSAERCIVQALPHVHRDEWLGELAESEREHILSQVDLIGGYPFNPILAQEAEEDSYSYAYDPESFDEPTA